MEKTLSSNKKSGTFLLITNIPYSFHSKELRNFFSYFINKKAFIIFHYRHRPEDAVLEYLLSVKNVLQSNLDNLFITDKVFRTLNTETENKILNSIQQISEIIDIAFKAQKGEDPILHNINENPSSNVNKTTNSVSYNKNNQNDNTELKERQINKLEENHRCCCLILIKDEYLESFQSIYNKKFWVTTDGIILPIRCLIFELSLVIKSYELINKNENISGSSLKNCYSNRFEMTSQKKEFSFDNLKDIMELNAPSIMPEGNIGTSKEYFKLLLDQCKLPGSIISKLGLEFNKRERKKRMYNQVNMNYGTKIRAGCIYPDFSESIFTENGDLIPGYFDIKFNKPLQISKQCKRPIIELEREEEDGAEIEEWERYEAFHNDVTKHERTKERIFENEIELVWEKGGSGLVFYTDAQFWRAYEGGEEERERDEWDVDITPYYEEGVGDLDARDSVSMLEMNELKLGKSNSSVFSPAESAKKRSLSNQFSKRLKGLAMTGNNHKYFDKFVYPANIRKKEESSEISKHKYPSAVLKNKNADSSKEIGNFEQHTKGIGRRLLEAQGWKDGEGLGREKKGMAYALGSSGKHPTDKNGIGFCDLNNLRNSSSDTFSTRKIKSKILISTAFDNPERTDPRPPIIRSSEPNSLSHRSSIFNIKFQKSKSVYRNVYR